MAKKKKKRKISRGSFIAVLLLFLLMNIVMAFVMMNVSQKELRGQIEARMLDIANTAAYQLNGDELKTLTAEDAGTEPYNRALETLRAFQNNIQLDYIYGIQQEADGSFSFTIDPAPENPGAFGEQIETTDALVAAAKGTPGVDKEAYTDDWGTFYSAYSPVFDSEGKVAGIVGVDFDAAWFDAKVSSRKVMIVMICMVTLSLLLLLWLMLHTSGLEGEKAEAQKQLAEALQREQMQQMTLGSARKMVYTDSMTGVKSKRAFTEMQNELNRRILDGTLREFAVIVCDLNGLKTINDTLGHEEGDNYIKKACELICKHFAHSPVFRVGGDEFVVILQSSDFRIRESLLGDFDAQMEKNCHTGEVVVSTGMAEFDDDADDCVEDVFERADQKMYERKRYLKSL